MRLYLARHGEALDETVDPVRPLSPRGRAEVERMALFLRRAGVRVAHGVHSGKRRAEETAELLAEAVMPEGTVQAHTGLLPNDAVEPVAETIAGWRADTLVVGHLPFLGRLMALLTRGAEEGVAFAPASVACLEHGPHGWRLLWLIRPELFPE